MNQNQKITFKNEEFIIPFPNVGQLLKIESLKMILSMDKYGELINTNTKASVFALDLIDAIATLSTLCPQLSSQLPKENYNEMSIPDGRELVKCFKEEFYPWYSENMKEVEVSKQ